MFVAALIEEGGHDVANSALIGSLRRLFPDDCVDTANCTENAMMIFQNTGVVRTAQTDQDRQFSLHPTGSRLEDWFSKAVPTKVFKPDVEDLPSSSAAPARREWA
ncbi:MAG: hypothetical protein WCE38_03850 [Burkholderiales bacterium]